MWSRTPDRRWLPHCWIALLVVLLLGPALGPGYVLSYDMVWVPQMALRPDFLGLGSALPRAVPSDLVVALAGAVLPAMLVQKVVLVGSLVAAAEGMLRLVGSSLSARLVVATLAVWNPFTVERLWLGHWTVLVGYGAVPWLLLAARRVRLGGSAWPVWLLLPLGSLSATAGLVSACVVLVSGASWRPGLRHRTLLLVAAVGCANAPWILTGLVHGGAAETAASTRPFALGSEGSLPAPLAALSMGGVWNTLVVPGSRQTFLAWLTLMLLVVLAASGAPAWWRGRGRVDGGRDLTLWGLGLLAAMATWATPGATEWLAQQVPGGGLLRDGTRSLGLCLPVFAAVPASGAAVLVDRLGQHDRLARAMIGGLLTAAPALLLYDAAWGISGHVTAVDFPSSWSAARAAVSTGQGDVLILPFEAYQAPAWNAGHPTMDPLGRFLRPDYLMSDRLLVDGHLIAGEDPRVPKVLAALAESSPTARSQALRALGVRYVANEAPTQRPPALAGTVVLSARDLSVTDLGGPVGAAESWSGAALTGVALAWSAYAASLMIGLGGLARSVRKGRSRRASSA